MTADLGLSPVAAADLLSINAVELLGGILSVFSVFSVFAVVRLAAVARRLLEDRRIAKRVERATAALKRKDFLTACQGLREACSIKPRDTRLTLLLAAVYHRAGNTLQAHFEYRNVVEWGAGDEPSVDLGGAAISLRAIAATGALATSDALAKSSEHRDSWRKHVIELSRAGVTAFESVGNDNVDRRFVKRFGEGSLLPPLLLSGAPQRLHGRPARRSSDVPTGARGSATAGGAHVRRTSRRGSNSTFRAASSARCRIPATASTGGAAAATGSSRLAIAGRPTRVRGHEATGSSPRNPASRSILANCSLTIDLIRCDRILATHRRASLTRYTRPRSSSGSLRKRTPWVAERYARSNTALVGLASATPSLVAKPPKTSGTT